MKENIYIFSNSVLKKQNNTLAIERYSEEISKDISTLDGEEALVYPEKEYKGINRKIIPTENVDSIFAFGSVNFNTPFLSMAAKHFIPVHIFNYYGRYIGSFLSGSEITSGNILIAQVNAYNTAAKRLQIAKLFVKGAIANSIGNLKYYKYRGTDLQSEIDSLEKFYSNCDEVFNIGELMGNEGNAKSVYYSAFTKIFNKEIEFSKRTKRPPDNLVNAMLSYGNAIVYAACLNEIYRTGLSPAIGYLHSPGDNRTPLSFDLAEIFKPLITDKIIFKMVNTGMVDEKDAYFNNDKVYLKDEIKKKFIAEIDNKLKSTIYLDKYKRQVSLKTIIRFECYALIKLLTENINYIPYSQKI